MENLVEVCSHSAVKCGYSRGKWQGAKEKPLGPLPRNCGLNRSVDEPLVCSVSQNPVWRVIVILILPTEIWDKDMWLSQGYLVYLWLTWTRGDNWSRSVFSPLFLMLIFIHPFVPGGEGGTILWLAPGAKTSWAGPVHHWAPRTLFVWMSGCN